MTLVFSLNAADFRSVNWGMSRQMVQKTETGKLLGEVEGDLIYQIKLGDQDVYIAYGFEDEKLVRARYEFSEHYRESQKYMEAFEALQAQLVRKYGQPLSTLVRCNDPFYMDNPSRWGTGVVVGKLSREANWRQPLVNIRHTMRALPGGLVGHAVEYSPAQKTANELESSAIFGAL